MEDGEGGNRGERRAGEGEVLVLGAADHREWGKEEGGEGAGDLLREAVQVQEDAEDQGHLGVGLSPAFH